MKLVTTYVILFIFSSLFLFFARQVAIQIGLVDKPNFRKRHIGAIPLVGGISIFAGICFYNIFYWDEMTQPFIYLLCAAILVITGALDDRFDLSVKTRMLVQTVVACIMMFVAGLYIKSLGNILGPWELVLNSFGYIVTLLAVFSAINAFNMVDGIDGLLGGLSCVSFGALGILLYIDGQPQLAALCLAIIITILPYIFLNLGIFGMSHKVFMGDAGSTLIGFTIIWIILQSTQGQGHPMNPVTALWVIAIPLIDMIATMYRRISKGKSPFSADRQHLHHIMLRSGFSARETFVIITSIAAFLAFIGVLGEHLSFVTEWMMLVLFLVLFVLYGFFLKRAWRLARFIRRIRRRYHLAR